MGDGDSPRKAKQNLSNKEVWGQKQLSKKIEKALDWKGDCSKLSLNIQCSTVQLEAVDFASTEEMALNFVAKMDNL